MSWKKSFGANIDSKRFHPCPNEPPDIRSDEGFYASQERCIILKTEDYHEDEDCICRLRQGIELTDLDEQQGSKCIAITKSQPGLLDVVRCLLQVHLSILNLNI